MLIFLLLTLAHVHGYLELEIVRYPSQKQAVPWDMNKCPAQQLNPEYTQICYHKDISYVVELIHDQQIYYMAIDFTAPISWIKGSQCKIQTKNIPCKHIQNTLQSEIHSGIISMQNKLKNVQNKIKNVISKESTMFDTKQAPQQVITSGSIDKVTGALQRAKNIEFWTKDTGKLATFQKLLLIGLFLSGEKSKITLTNSNFIQANNISSHLDKISDGAISLRFDTQSENSFLNQIFKFVGNNEKYVTIFLGRNKSITIGDLSVKNAQNGYSGIQWIALDDKRFPDVTALSVEYSESEDIKSSQCKVQAVLTLSASYISIPLKPLEQLLKNLEDVGKCRLGKNQFVQCVKTKSTIAQTKLIFEFDQIKLSLDLQELLKSETNKAFILNIRKSESDNYIILGEPIFKKYFAVFDFQKNRIGVAIRRHSFVQALIQIVTLVRFLTFTFILGCCTILCFRPCSKFFKAFTIYNKMQNLKSGSQSKRLKYSSIQQNPYEQVNHKIKSVLSNQIEAI